MTPNKCCSVPDCDKPHRSLGLCEAHYYRQRRHGDVGILKRPAPSKVPAELRWMDRVAVESPGCWLWRGSYGGNGYPIYQLPEGNRVAHRYVYELLVGPIAAGLQLDHLCRVIACVNPDHLEPVTHAENVRRSHGPSAAAARRTACAKGHEYEPNNVRYRRDGRGRVCLTCERAFAEKYRHQKEIQC